MIYIGLQNTKVYILNETGCMAQQIYPDYFRKYVWHTELLHFGPFLDFMAGLNCVKAIADF